VQLKHPNSLNTKGVGARVRITTESGQQLRWVLAGTSLSSGAPLEAHFGLGETDIILEVQILWPDQTISVLNNVDVNQIVQVTRLEE
jgi:hypothetical protein